jgi:hypothetical protein
MLIAPKYVIDVARSVHPLVTAKPDQGSSGETRSEFPITSDRGYPVWDWDWNDIIRLEIRHARTSLCSYLMRL